MELVLQVLQIVAPVFILASIGFLWVRTGHDYDVAFVTRLAMNLAIPCLIFSALMRSQIEPSVLWSTALAALLAHGVIGGLVALYLWATGMEQRAFWPALTFGNTGNIGLPLALFAFGPRGLDYAVVIFAVSAVLVFTVGLWVIAGRGRFLSVLREPMVIGTALGVLFLSQGWRLPEWAENTIDLAGQLGIPLMLLTLGVAISGLRPGAIGLAVWLSALKLGICVAAGWGVGLALGLPAEAHGVLILQMAAPVAVTNYLLAQRHGARPAEVAGLVMVSTSMAVVSIPVLLAFLI
jgi:predicted permease